MSKSRPGRRAPTVPRRRRTAEEARRVILDAAEKRLREGGPDAIRLQDIAREVGISHPTILHHFESRDGLTRALALRARDRLEAELLEVLEAGPATETTALGVIERIFGTLGDAGHARLLAWRALQAQTPDPPQNDAEDRILRKMGDLLHARRTEYREQHGMPPVDREDSEFVVRLTTAAMLGDGIFGPTIDHMAGRDSDPDVRRRFRAWFARMLVDQLTRE